MLTDPVATIITQAVRTVAASLVRKDGRMNLTTGRMRSRSVQAKGVIRCSCADHGGVMAMAELGR